MPRSDKDLLLSTSYLIRQYQKAFLASEDRTHILRQLNKAGSKGILGKRFWLTQEESADLVLYTESKEPAHTLQILASTIWLITREGLVCLKSRTESDLDLVTRIDQNAAKLTLKNLQKLYP